MRLGVAMKNPPFWRTQVRKHYHIITKVRPVALPVRVPIPAPPPRVVRHVAPCHKMASQGSFLICFVIFFLGGGHPKQPKSNWICVKRFQSLNMFKHENKLRKQHTYLRNLTFRSESKDAERVGMSLSTGMGSQSFMDFTLNTLYERTLLWVFGCF